MNITKTVTKKLSKKKNKLQAEIFFTPFGNTPFLKEIIVLTIKHQTNSNPKEFSLQ